MARKREIKPGFFKNEELAELPVTTRLIFIAMWTMADKDGRLEDRPKKIKMENLPYDDFDPDEAIQNLHDRSFIIRYEVDGQKYIQITNWKKHQNPHPKEAPSTIPEVGGYIPNDIKNRVIQPASNLQEHTFQPASNAYTSYTSFPSIPSCTSKKEEEVLIAQPETESPPPPKVKIEKPGFNWFQIQRPGETYPGGKYSEKEWLRREIYRKLRGKGYRIRADSPLDELTMAYSYAWEVVNKWMQYPAERRLAAYAYAVIEKSVMEPIDYALKALEGGWEQMEKNVKRAASLLERGNEIDFT